MFKRFMQPRERLQFTLQGDFIHVMQCPDFVRLESHHGYMDVGQGGQLNELKPGLVVTVENLSDVAGEVILQYGPGGYTPSADGQQVVVTAMPRVEVAPGQEVGIKTMPAVKIAPGQGVAVSDLPPVKLVAGQSVNVGELPAVSLAENQSVAVSQLPEVGFKPGQSVSVSELPAVSLASGATVKVYAATPLAVKPSVASGLVSSTVVMTTGAAELAANANRCHVLLKALAENTQAIVLGGVWTLSPGEQIKLDTTAALPFTGLDGEGVQVLEVTR